MKHDLAGDPIEVAGASDDDKPVVTALDVTPVLEIAAATDVTVEVKDPMNMPHVVPDLDPTDTVVVVVPIDQLPLEPEAVRRLVEYAFSKTLKWGSNGSGAAALRSNEAEAGIATRANPSGATVTSLRMDSPFGGRD